MKNILRLGSVFLTLALLISTLLLTGVLAAAEPTATAATATDVEPTATATEATGPVAVASWTSAAGVDYTYVWQGTEYINVYSKNTGVDGKTWKQFANQICTSVAADEYMVYELRADLTGVNAANVALENSGYDNNNSAAVVEEATDSYLRIRMDGPFASLSRPDPFLNLTISKGMETAADRAAASLTVTVYRGPHPTTPATSGNASNPSASGSQPSGTPGVIQKNVLWDGDVTATVTVSNYRGALNNTDVDTAIRQDIAANGTIEGDEYYEITTTGYMQGKSGYAVGGFATGDFEFWGNAKAAGCAMIGTSTGTTTQKCAAGDTDKKGNLLADKMNASKTQFVFFSEASGFTDTVYVSHLTISVYRYGAGPAPSESVSTPSASESTPSASESTPSASEPVVDPTATHVVVLAGDANGDGAVNMKDVLAMRKYIAGLDAEIRVTAADVNVDGAVNMKDVLAVRKYLAGLGDLGEAEGIPSFTDPPGPGIVIVINPTTPTTPTLPTITLPTTALPTSPTITFTMPTFTLPTTTEPIQIETGHIYL